jgi:succinate dehydrogenase/fumarate reductase-like Fe-S protein
LKDVDLDLFEPFDTLIRIEFLGRAIEVPDNNCLLRALQYVAGESIAYGRFCWNDECGNCQARVHPGMKVVQVSPDVQVDLE